MRRTAILLGGIAVLALLLTPATGAATARRGGRRRRPAAAGRHPALDARGRELYQNACASCHGPDPAGPSYYPTVPSLNDVGGAAAVNWALRTGRMPWKDNKGPAIERGEPRFNDEDIHALATYIGKAVGDAQIPDVDPARGNLQRGRELYGQACAACHGMNGAGAAPCRCRRRPPGRGRGDQDRPRADAGRRRPGRLRVRHRQEPAGSTTSPPTSRACAPTPTTRAAPPSAARGRCPRGSWPG